VIGVNRFMRLSILFVALLFFGAIIAGCLNPAVGGKQAKEPVKNLSFRTEDVTGVVVTRQFSGEPASIPRRITDRMQIALVLKALERVAQLAQPEDLLGPPMQISLELTVARRNLELWGPRLLVDRDNDITYDVPDEVYQDLMTALESSR
jgi:hypothetical protein